MANCLQVRREGKRVRTFTRRGYDWRHRFADGPQTFDREGYSATADWRGHENEIVLPWASPGTLCEIAWSLPEHLN
jgi:hypothetical protein